MYDKESVDRIDIESQFFKYLHIFSPLTKTNWFGGNQKSTVKSCHICNNYLFFSGKTVYSRENVDIRVDSMYRPHLLVVPVLHEDHVVNGFNPFSLLRMISCIDSFVEKYNVVNYNVEYRSGSWNSHDKNVYMRITLDASEFLSKFKPFLSCSKEKWKNEYKKATLKNISKQKLWLNEELKNLR